MSDLIGLKPGKKITISYKAPFDRVVTSKGTIALEGAYDKDDYILFIRFLSGRDIVRIKLKDVLIYKRGW